MPQVKWIDESQAASKLGYSNVRSFRRRVKSGELSIARTDNGKGRAYQYNEHDINKLLLTNSTYIKPLSCLSEGNF